MYYILQKVSADFAQFVDFWAAQYNSNKPLEWAFDSLDISKAILTPSDIKALFVSKEESIGGFFSFQKMGELIKGIDTMNQLKKNFEEELFKKEFGHLPIAGQIALLHLINPTMFPMFDQHIYRGYQFLKQNKLMDLEDLPKSEQFNAYIEYKAYILGLVTESIVLKKIDKAMWAYGKFLGNEAMRKFWV
ncbi:MAG: hypothetical protein ACKVTZ_03350 [Bacteroidia bacterium]